MKFCRTLYVNVTDKARSRGRGTPPVFLCEILTKFLLNKTPILHNYLPEQLRLFFFFHFCDAVPLFLSIFYISSRRFYQNVILCLLKLATFLIDDQSVVVSLNSCTAAFLPPPAFTCRGAASGAEAAIRFIVGVRLALSTEGALN